MAAPAFVGHIEPAPPSPQPASSSPDPHPTPTPDPPPGSSIQEEGASDEESDEGDYYDIMIVGITGQGKSTTADKMIIAADMEAAFRDDEAAPRDEPKSDGDEVKSKKRGIAAGDLTIWSVGDIPEDKKTDIVGYLKRLKLSRCLQDPHLDVNDYYQQEEDRLTEEGAEPATSLFCQLISNDTTGIRVLDVPGFFTPVSDTNPDYSPILQSSRALERGINLCNQKHLVVMRSILRIQSTMRTRFRRIMYFLPVRGPLHKNSEVLMQELRVLALYFGKCIFECMILVATLPSFVSNHPFPENELKKTRIQFHKALKDALHLHCSEVVPNPPIIFISMGDKCETIVKKVKDAEVAKDSLELTIDPGVCVKCSSLIKWLGEERVECIPVGKSENDAVPFGESSCHPIFVPKDGILKTIEVESGVPYVVIGKKKGRVLNDSTEVCLNCKRSPGTIGCIKVGESYKVKVKDGKSADITVDHTNKIEEHRMLSQEEKLAEAKPAEGEDAEQDAQIGTRRRGGRRVPDNDPDQPQHRIIEDTDLGAAAADGGGGGVEPPTSSIPVPGGVDRRRPQRIHRSSDTATESEESSDQSLHRTAISLGGSSIVAQTSDGYESAKLVSGKNLSKDLDGGVWSSITGRRREQANEEASLLDEAGYANMKGV